MLRISSHAGTVARNWRPDADLSGGSRTKGPGSFAMSVGDYPDFQEAILRKLRRELSPGLIA
jgi:hypothetical protein